MTCAARRPPAPGRTSLSQNHPAALRCALYGLKPSEVKGTGFPNLPSSPGRGRHIAHFELCFLVERDGVGLELRVEREEELRLLEDVYATHREKIDAILTFVRLGVDGPVASRLLPLSGMIQAAKDADDAWLAVFEPRYPFPIAASEVNGERKTTAAGGYSTASATATAAPSDSPK